MRRKNLIERSEDMKEGGLPLSRSKSKLLFTESHKRIEARKQDR